MVESVAQIRMHTERFHASRCLFSLRRCGADTGVIRSDNGIGGDAPGHLEGTLLYLAEQYQAEVERRKKLLSSCVLPMGVFLMGYIVLSVDRRRFKLWSIWPTRSCHERAQNPSRSGHRFPPARHYLYSPVRARGGTNHDHVQNTPGRWTWRGIRWRITHGGRVGSRGDAEVAAV